MTNCPEWAWKLIGIGCMAAAIFLIGYFDPIYDRIWGNKFSQVWSTIFIFTACGVMGASLWWNLVASGRKIAVGAATALAGEISSGVTETASSSDWPLWIGSPRLSEKSATISIQNIGTKTQEMTAQTQIAIEASPQTETPHYPFVPTLGPMPVKPNTSKNVSCNFSDGGRLPDVKSGKAFLYFYGLISYYDTNNSSQRYEATFCFQYDAESKQLVKTPFGNELKRLTTTPPSSIPDKSASPP